MIRDVGESDLEATRAFLEAHVETSLFLLGNLAEHGPRLGAHLNSGTFRAIYEREAIVAVFCLARRGNLLVQTGGRADLAPAILAACEAEPIAIHGVVGEWIAAQAVWQLLCAKPGFRPGLAQREVLYARALPFLQSSSSMLGTRMLDSRDFESWHVLNVAYCAEVQVPLQGTREERRAVFSAQAKAGHWWGHFDGDQLVGTAALNASYKHIGQVGGVYTRPGYRGRGLAGLTMQALMRDASEHHGLERLILFTGEDNLAARRLYESLDFKTVGYFGLLFGIQESPAAPVL